MGGTWEGKKCPPTEEHIQRKKTKKEKKKGNIRWRKTKTWEKRLRPRFARGARGGPKAGAGAQGVPQESTESLLEKEKRGKAKREPPLGGKAAGADVKVLDFAPVLPYRRERQEARKRGCRPRRRKLRKVYWAEVSAQSATGNAGADK